MQCGTVLLKTVELACEKTYLYPQLTYCYLGLEVSLQRLLLHPDFSIYCELWRSRQIDKSVLWDIYDGRINHMEVNSFYQSLEILRYGLRSAIQMCSIRLEPK